jgi:hypothetical protein
MVSRMKFKTEINRWKLAAAKPGSQRRLIVIARRSSPAFPRILAKLVWKRQASHGFCIRETAGVVSRRGNITGQVVPIGHNRWEWSITFNTGLAMSGFRSSPFSAMRAALMFAQRPRYAWRPVRWLASL